MVPCAPPAKQAATLTQLTPARLSKRSLRCASNDGPLRVPPTATAAKLPGDSSPKTGKPHAPCRTISHADAVAQLTPTANGLAESESLAVCQVEPPLAVVVT